MTKADEVNTARRISVAMIDAARTGKHMSIKAFLDMAAGAGIIDGEKVLRLTIRVAWFAAETARAALDALDTAAPGMGDQLLRDVKVRVARTTTEPNEGPAADV